MGYLAAEAATKAFLFLLAVTHTLGELIINAAPFSRVKDWLEEAVDKNRKI